MDKTTFGFSIPKIKKLTAMLVAAGEVPPNTASHIVLAALPFLRKVITKARSGMDDKVLQPSLKRFLSSACPSMFFSNVKVELPPELQKDHWPPILKADVTYKSGRTLSWLWCEQSMAVLGIQSFCSILEPGEVEPVYYADPSFISQANDGQLQALDTPANFEAPTTPQKYNWRLTYLDKESLGPNYYTGSEEVLSIIKTMFWMTRKPAVLVESWFHDPEAKVDRWVNVTDAIPATRYQLTVDGKDCYFYSKSVMDKYKEVLADSGKTLVEHDFWQGLEIKATEVLQ